MKSEAELLPIGKNFFEYLEEKSKKGNMTVQLFLIETYAYDNETKRN